MGRDLNVPGTAGERGESCTTDHNCYTYVGTHVSVWGNGTRWTIVGLFQQQSRRQSLLSWMMGFVWRKEGRPFLFRGGYLSRVA